MALSGGVSSTPEEMWQEIERERVESVERNAIRASCDMARDFAYVLDCGAIGLKPDPFKRRVPYWDWLTAEQQHRCL